MWAWSKKPASAATAAHRCCPASESTRRTRLIRAKEHWHRPGERAVRDSGRSWTILRPTTFASNALVWADDIRSGRPVANLFGDGRQGIVDPADVAAVAAEALTGTYRAWAETHRSRF